mmetsp:Transcript_126868/g.189279  ORF Transcript_126868/g.189279 Transcript_126868/m.189279 type:complete len:380 (-) Transcript_126868:46-1185(-)
MSDVLTCICCRQTFETPNAQRTHYQGDYHRFNLKRKVLNLPPVSQELFQQKVAELKEKQTVKEVFTGYCTFCKKKFSNPKTYGAHIKSKKHLEKERIARDDASDEELEGTTTTITKQPIDQSPIQIKKQDDEEPKTEEEFIAEKVKNAHHFEEDECFICMQHCGSFELNIEHMAKEHGLYIPDLDYVSDLGGLMAYLAQKVGTGNACLYCNKIFQDTEAVANHMRSSNHAKLKYDDDDMDEYEEFYDFSKTWDTVEGEDDFDENEDITPEQQQQLILKSGKGIVDVDEDGYNLTLANGKKIGHRDLAIYYKQDYSRINRNPEATKAVLNKYKALGWKTQVSKKERVAQRRQQRKYFTEQMQVGVKSNRLQKFFREQVLY